MLVLFSLMQSFQSIAETAFLIQAEIDLLCLLFPGYVYMNGDIAKVPSGAVYPATPDPLTVTQPSAPNYRYNSLVFTSPKTLISNHNSITQAHAP